MTESLYMDDCYLREFNATIERVGDDFLILDRSAFYPTGGGQPADHGTIRSDDLEARVTDVQKEQGKVRHYVDSTDGFEPGMSVEGEIDWERRHQHMRMHTAQHLLSAIVLDLYDAGVAGNQIHADQSRIDFEPVQFTEEEIKRLENEFNSRIEEEKPVKIYEIDRDELEDRLEVGRTNLDLIPDHIDPLRVVEITGIDICPCGGTHVQNIGEIGHITIVERKSKGEDIDRLTFELEG